jgi:hypothetical protein
MPGAFQSFTEKTVVSVYKTGISSPFLEKTIDLSGYYQGFCKLSEVWGCGRDPRAIGAGAGNERSAERRHQRQRFAEIRRRDP